MPSPSYKTLYRRAQFLHQLGRDLERMSASLDATRVVRFVLRGLGEVLEADVAIQVDLTRSDQSMEAPVKVGLTARGQRLLGHAEAGDGAAFHTECRRFLSTGLGSGDRQLLLVKVATGERVVAVLGFRRPGRNFGRADAFLGQDAALLLSAELSRRERERGLALKEKIYAKLFAELRPKDVLYQILHGLERLLQYDHSASLFLVDPDDPALELHAEIVTWTKAKSTRIGHRFPVDQAASRWLARDGRVTLMRAGSSPVTLPAGGESNLPPSLLAIPGARAPGAPEARGVLLAPLRRKNDPLGLLVISGRSESAFVGEDLRALEPFLTPAAATLYNASLYKAQGERLATAERKVALADLARAISHDLNNAFGVMLPLLQTLKRDIQGRCCAPEQLAEDVEVVTHYAETSARIFKGLLSVARGRAERPHWLDLNVVLDSLVEMLSPSFGAAGVRVERTRGGDLPKVFGRRGEVEQLLLNLIQNAKDAMVRGGTIHVATRPEGEGVRIEIVDEGGGIPKELEGRIFEPFFTTKSRGSGLGLDICRSIVWDYDGRMDLTSRPGEGTTASLWLPRLCHCFRDEAGAHGDLGAPLGAGLLPGGNR